jgi:hypothetical protein
MCPLLTPHTQTAINNMVLGLVGHVALMVRGCHCEAAHGGPRGAGAIPLDGCGPLAEQGLVLVDLGSACNRYKQQKGMGDNEERCDGMDME